MADLLNYFSQETKSVRTTKNIVIKFVFWINCAALTIAFVDYLGYQLDDSFALDAKNIIRLFSKHQLILGLTFYLILTSIFRLIGDIVTIPLSRWYGKIFFSRPYIKAEPDYIQSFLNHQIAENSNSLNEEAAIIKENELSIRNFSEMILTFPFTYYFIVGTNFPKAYHIILLLAMFIPLILVFWTRAKMKYRSESLPDWIKRVDVYLGSKITPTTSPTTATTTTATPSAEEKKS